MVLEFRAASHADHDWLFELDRISMAPYASPTTPARTMIQQRERFDRHFDPAQLKIIVADGQDCGVLRVETRDTDLYLAVIEIEPQAQGRGIGTAVLQAVLARAKAEHKPVALRVHTANLRARRFYERLGFRPVGETATKIDMRHEG